jgi:hypothetical protein
VYSDLVNKKHELYRYINSLPLSIFERKCLKARINTIQRLATETGHRKADKYFSFRFKYGEKKRCGLTNEWLRYYKTRLTEAKKTNDPVALLELRLEKLEKTQSPKKFKAILININKVTKNPGKRAILECYMDRAFGSEFYKPEQLVDSEFPRTFLEGLPALSARA